MLPPDKLQVEVVSPENIREMFNDGQYAAMIASGRLVATLLRHRHLQHPEQKNEPYCTHAQMIRYSTQNGQWVVEVFQYLRPDGSIGASGRPDPKRLRIGRTVFMVQAST